MFLLLHFILRSVAAYRAVIVAMWCVIVLINNYLSIYLPLVLISCSSWLSALKVISQRPLNTIELKKIDSANESNSISFLNWKSDSSSKNYKLSFTEWFVHSIPNVVGLLTTVSL